MATGARRDDARRWLAPEARAKAGVGRGRPPISGGNAHGFRLSIRMTAQSPVAPVHRQPPCKLQITHACMPDSIQGIREARHRERRGRCQFSRQSARQRSLAGQTGDALRSGWNGLRRHQAMRNPPALRRGRTKFGYDGTVITWLPEPDDGSAFPTLSDPCFATATP